MMESCGRVFVYPLVFLLLFEICSGDMGLCTAYIVIIINYSFKHTRLTYTFIFTDCNCKGLVE